MCSIHNAGPVPFGAATRELGVKRGDLVVQTFGLRGQAAGSGRKKAAESANAAPTSGPSLPLGHDYGANDAQISTPGQLIPLKQSTDSISPPAPVGGPTKLPAGSSPLAWRPLFVVPREALAGRERQVVRFIVADKSGAALDGPRWARAGRARGGAKKRRRCAKRADFMIMAEVFWKFVCESGSGSLGQGAAGESLVAGGPARVVRSGLAASSGESCGQAASPLEATRTQLGPKIGSIPIGLQSWPIQFEQLAAPLASRGWQAGPARASWMYISLACWLPSNGRDERARGKDRASAG